PPGRRPEARRRTRTLRGRDRPCLRRGRGTPRSPRGERGGLTGGRTAVAAGCDIRGAFDPRELILRLNSAGGRGVPVIARTGGGDAAACLHRPARVSVDLLNLPPRARRPRRGRSEQVPRGLEAHRRPPL